MKRWAWNWEKATLKRTCPNELHGDWVLFLLDIRLKGMQTRTTFPHAQSTFWPNYSCSWLCLLVKENMGSLAHQMVYWRCHTFESSLGCRASTSQLECLNQVKHLVAWLPLVAFGCLWLPLVAFGWLRLSCEARERPRGFNTEAVETSRNPLVWRVNSLTWGKTAVRATSFLNVEMLGCLELNRISNSTELSA